MKKKARCQRKSSFLTIWINLHSFKTITLRHFKRKPSSANCDVGFDRTNCITIWWLILRQYCYLDRLTIFNFEDKIFANSWKINQNRFYIMRHIDNIQGERKTQLKIQCIIET